MDDLLTTSYQRIMETFSHFSDSAAHGLQVRVPCLSLFL